MVFGLLLAYGLLPSLRPAPGVALRVGFEIRAAIGVLGYTGRKSQEHIILPEMVSVPCEPLVSCVVLHGRREEEFLTECVG